MSDAEALSGSSFMLTGEQLPFIEGRHLTRAPFVLAPSATLV
jgi:hypothetical protein